MTSACSSEEKRVASKFVHLSPMRWNPMHDDYFAEVFRSSKKRRVGPAVNGQGPNLIWETHDIIGAFTLVAREGNQN